MGEMVAAVKPHFEEIYSIELEPGLCRRARAKFAQYPWIHAECGDGADVLPRILDTVTRPAIWLHGHYSLGITAKGGAGVTPI